MDSAGVDCDRCLKDAALFRKASLILLPFYCYGYVSCVIGLNSFPLTQLSLEKYQPFPIALRWLPTATNFLP
jgi:hypothetical protein